MDCIAHGLAITVDIVLALGLVVGLGSGIVFGLGKKW